MTIDRIPHVYRLFLCSSHGTQMNGSVYDVQFRNIQLPVDAVSHHADDRWFVFAEAFVTDDTVKGGGASAIPFAVVTDLPILNASSNLPDGSIPVVVLGPAQDLNTTCVQLDGVGHKLLGPPSQMFQSNSLRVRVVGIDGSILSNDAGQVWSISLSIYRLGYK